MVEGLNYLPVVSHHVRSYILLYLHDNYIEELAGWVAHMVE